MIIILDELLPEFCTKTPVVYYLSYLAAVGETGASGKVVSGAVVPGAGRAGRGGSA